MSFLDSTIFIFALKPQGNSVHSTFISPWQIHSLDTARYTVLVGKGFYCFFQSEVPEIHTNNTSKIYPAHLPPRRTGCDTINPTQQTEAVRERETELHIIQATDEELNPNEKYQMP